VIGVLHELARRCGVQLSFWDVEGGEHHALPEALVSVLRALGEELETVDDAPAALAAHEVRAAARVIDSCFVVWDGHGGPIGLGAPAHGAAVSAVLELESGDTRALEVHDNSVHLGGEVPIGYHWLRVDVAGAVHDCAVICAPWTCYMPADRKPVWGAFAPLYSMRSARSDRFGGADFKDLGRAIEWINSLGGDAVGTLPLLATFEGDDSPYLPVSRRLWNELYLDLDEIPEVEGLPDGFERESAALAAMDLVDYPRLAKHRRSVLADAAKRLYASSSTRRDELERWLLAHPLVDEYAAFRGGSDESERRYHRYVQWQCRQQLDVLTHHGLYLDLPVGVHPEGFDAWREREVFAQGVAVGAPPDALFAGGQNWAVPALHPQRSRAQGHRYFAECVRTHTELARALRIDHVMGLYRRYWIPPGFEPTEGIYVDMPANELVAVLAIESQRHETVIVGEDLGTVQPRVREDMATHDMRRLHVAQFSLDEPVAHSSVASLNTHDTPLFGAFWDGDDARGELERQLERLAGSDAWMTIVTLEDLWLEKRQQNVPGPPGEHPNWRGKMKLSLDELEGDAEVGATLRKVGAIRDGAG